MQALSNVRANQKSALGLSNGLFTGAIAVTALVVDPKSLTFNVNITYQTGDAQNPSRTFTPMNDDGLVRKFGSLDDVIKWVQGAFLDFTAITFTIDEAGLIAKAFVPPTDPLANALKQKTAFQKLSDGLADNATRANLKVDQAIASGWDLPSAHPALQANYAALVKNQESVEALGAYYDGQVSYWNGIANPA